MTVKDRLSKFLQEEGINQKEFGEVVGYSQQSLSNFFSGNTKIPRGDLFIALAEHFPNLNLRWLLIGDGKMWRSEELQENKVAYQQLMSQIENLQRENKDLRQLLITKEELLKTKEELIALVKQKLDTKDSE